MGGGSVRQIDKLKLVSKPLNLKVIVILRQSFLVLGWFPNMFFSENF